MKQITYSDRTINFERIYVLVPPKLKFVEKLQVNKNLVFKYLFYVIINVYLNNNNNFYTMFPRRK